MPETARTIYRGTAVALVEGPHLYKLNGYYYLFAAQGGTVFTHQEVVARSKTPSRPTASKPSRATCS
ncbi:family 43 glycosylhydrolase [Klebsiella pneumoniae subsp. pneumoniae]|nr:family 43 glycosylhydrolase [Klebsiella pneumoniae subsp. pneumoniae]